MGCGSRQAPRVRGCCKCPKLDPNNRPGAVSSSKSGDLEQMVKPVASSQGVRAGNGVRHASTLRGGGTAEEHYRTIIRSCRFDRADAGVRGRAESRAWGAARLKLSKHARMRQLSWGRRGGSNGMIDPSCAPGAATCIAAGENRWQEIRLNKIFSFRCHGGGCRVVLSSTKTSTILILAWRIELNFQGSSSF
jgi:hypothetical protein